MGLPRYAPCSAFRMARASSAGSLPLRLVFFLSRCSQCFKEKKNEETVSELNRTSLDQTKIVATDYKKDAISVCFDRISRHSFRMKVVLDLRVIGFICCAARRHC